MKQLTGIEAAAAEILDSEDSFGRDNSGTNPEFSCEDVHAHAVKRLDEVVAIIAKHCAGRDEFIGPNGAEKLLTREQWMAEALQ